MQSEACLAQIDLEFCFACILSCNILAHFHCLYQCLEGELGHLAIPQKFHQWLWLVQQFLTQHSPSLTITIFPRSYPLRHFSLSKNKIPLEKEQDFKTWRKPKRIAVHYLKKISSRNASINANNAGQRMWFQKGTTSKRD